MRSLLVTAVVVSAAIALGGCPGKRQRPVPGPQSPTVDDTQRTAATRGHGASEISWFQGTLDEAFSRRTCHERQSLFHY